MSSKFENTIAFDPGIDTNKKVKGRNPYDSCHEISPEVYHCRNECHADLLCGNKNRYSAALKVAYASNLAYSPLMIP